MKIGTLRVAWPAGQTIGIALILVAIICGAAEALARDQSIQRSLPRPKISGHPQLAYKLQLLDRLEAKEGPVNCFAIGSSLVRTGIDPAAVDEAAAGRSLHCFNFGLDDMDSVGTAVLAQVLVRTHHPALIVYGTSYRDYLDTRGFPMDIAWADSWLGKPTLDGWLEDNSIAFRYAQAYRDIADGNAQDRTHLADTGFFNGKHVADVSKPPPSNPDGSTEGKVAIEISEVKLTHLDTLAEIARGGTEVVIVEMPQPEMTIDQLANGQDDYQLFLDAIRGKSAQVGLPFLQSQGSVIIPDDGWQDYKHMNGVGAQAFSVWLGQALGEMGGTGLMQPSKSQ